MAGVAQTLFALFLVGCGGSAMPVTVGVDAGVDDGAAEIDPQFDPEADVPLRPPETCPPIAARGKPVTIEVKTAPSTTYLTPDGNVVPGTYVLTSHVAYVAADAAVGPSTTYAMTLEVDNARFAILREEGGTTTMGSYYLVPLVPEDPFFDLDRACGDGPVRYRFVTLHPTATGFDMATQFADAGNVLHFEAVP